MEKIVIVGGVAAGATAAAKARRLSPNAEITLLEAGPDVSFANCGLPYYIAGDIKSRSKLILQSPESFKEQYNVKVFVNTRVDSINRAEKRLSTTNSNTGEENSFEYTKLILAQGGRPIQPDLPGADADHVFSLWTLNDMDRIDAYLQDQAPKTAVVVGGGFIGLEMVEALVKRGLKVHIVEKMQHVMSILEAETAGFIHREMLSFDVDVHTETAVTQIQKDSVELDNGKNLQTDMVLLSIGVRPTLQLAQEAGLEIGEAGGLLVNKQLQTSDPDIYAAGDMVELEHRVLGKKVRIPLAGPANRQGRIAAENALGGTHQYKGSIGTSVVRVFEAVAGTTGLSLKQARAAGIDADAIVVHKEHHTAYYPGAETVSVLLIFDKKTGVILGGQTAGYKGADKRLDVIATATATQLTVSDIADIDYAYSPPIGTANDAMNMAAYVAENKMSGYGPSLMVSELDNYLATKQQLIVLDVRDVFAHQKSKLEGAYHLPLEMLQQNLQQIPKDIPILVYDETGKKGHQAVRTLMGAGCQEVFNISGGHTSLQRHAATLGFKNFRVSLLPIEKKVIGNKETNTESTQEVAASETGPLVVDVRTREEFTGGAFPEAINIPLDDIMSGKGDFGENHDREIVVYCASGARSAYAQQMLMNRGYSRVVNGGGISAMMAKYH